MKILDTPRSGKCGNVVAFQSRYGLCLRELVIPRNPITEARQRMRGIFGHNSQMWSRILTQEQQERWIAAGANVLSDPRLGTRGPLTGQQFWQSINSVRRCVGLDPTFDPPAPVTFGPSPVGQLVITNDADGVRLYLRVSGELTEDVMVFAQAPCSPGRHKRRNVAYLGLLPPPIGGLSEITHLYKSRHGEPRSRTKVFIVTCQQKDGWKALDRLTSEIVPDRSATLPAAADIAAGMFSATATPSPSSLPHMYKGCPTPAQGTSAPIASQSRAPGKPAEGHANAAAPSSGGNGGG